MSNRDVERDRAGPMSETAEQTAPGPAPGRDHSFFGHPKGLPYLLAADCGWAFAFFGIQVSLTLYMTQVLLKPGHVEKVLGFGPYRAFLAHTFGAVSDTAVASQTFGIATGLVYALPILGGFIADRWIGQRRACASGLIVMVLACILMVREETFLFAIGFLVIGTGLMKATLVGQIGRLYAPDDDRRTRGFGLYLIALNTGSFITPLICGTLGERLGWPFGFMAMGVGMGLGAVYYMLGFRHMPADVVQRAPARLKDEARVAAPKLHAAGLRMVAILLVLIAVDGLWAGIYNQAFNILPIWADTHVERHIMGFLTPVTWINTLDGVLTIIGTAFAVRLWARQATKGGDGIDIRRITIGLILAGLAYLVLAGGAVIGGAGKAPLWPIVIFFLLIDFSIPWVDTVILTMISRDAPASLTSTMLGIYYLATAGGNFLNGWLGGFFDRMSPTAFWLIHAGLFGILLLLFLLGGSTLRRLLAANHEETEIVAAPA